MRELLLKPTYFFRHVAISIIRPYGKCSRTAFAVTRLLVGPPKMILQSKLGVCIQIR